MPPQTGAPDSRAVAEDSGRASPATQGAGSESRGGRDGRVGGYWERGAAVTVLRDVLQEGPGRRPAPPVSGPASTRTTPDLRVRLRARGFAEPGRAQNLGHGHLQPLVLGLERETELARDSVPRTCRDKGDKDKSFAGRKRTQNKEAEGVLPDPGGGRVGAGLGARPQYQSQKGRAAAAPGTVAGQRQSRGSATRQLLQQEGKEGPAPQVRARQGNRLGRARVAAPPQP